MGGQNVDLFERTKVVVTKELTATGWREILLDKHFRRRGLPKRRRRKLLPRNRLRPKNAADGNFATGKAYRDKFRNSKKPGKTGGKWIVDSG